MKTNSRFIFGLLSLLLAAVTAFVALPTIARQTNGKTEIVRVTAPISRGDLITADNTGTVEAGSYNLPPDIARSLDDVNGLYATADLMPGDYILSSKVSTMPISPDAVLGSIPSGKAAISLTVKTLAAGLSDKLQPGDIIRIYHFLDTAVEIPELRFVKVLSVTGADGINVDNSREPLDDEEKQQSATITVLASPEQARTITALENDGVAHVALVCRNNERLAAELLEDQDLTLREIYFPETLAGESAEGDLENGGGEGTGNGEDTSEDGIDSVPEGNGAGPGGGTADNSAPGRQTGTEPDHDNSSIPR